MLSSGKTTWTSGLIPILKSEDLAEIISHVSDLALIVSKSGVVQDVMRNPSYSGAPDASDWKGLPFQSLLTSESVPKFDNKLTEFLAQPGKALQSELNHKPTEARPEIPVQYSYHRIGAGSEALMLGRDLRAAAEIQQQLVAAQIALEKDYEAQRDNDIRFRVLMESSDSPTVFFTADTGQITACNAAAAKLFRKTRAELIDSSFVQEFDTSPRSNVLERVVAAAREQPAAPVAIKSKHTKQKLTLFPTLFRGATGQMVLCKIKLSGAGNTHQDKLQTQLSAFYQQGVDPMVFVGEDGNILSANESFMKLADRPASQGIQGLPMSDFFSRGTVDLNVILENARRSGSMRLFATKLVCEHGSERAIEISTTRLSTDDAPVFAMIIRDSRRVEIARTPMQQVTDVDMRSVIELIGSQSLKKIVARSTDVVEKMCIETAVQMTSNNRVAAAEMLGLSRQSLYVKLRKYDLI